MNERDRVNEKESKNRIQIRGFLEGGGLFRAHAMSWQQIEIEIGVK
jgi:hypothetical protein